MIRWFLFPLLIVSPAFGQGSTGILTGGSVGGGGDSASDWTGYFVAVWQMEGSAGEANDGGTCGTDCALTETGTVTEDTTNFVVGAGSRDGWGASNHLSCANATCNEITQSTGDLSYVVWARLPSLAGDAQIIDNLGSSNDGWRIFFDDLATDEFQAGYGDGGVNRKTVITPTGNIQTDTWYHLAWTHDSGTGQVLYIKSGATINESNTSSNTAVMAANTTQDFVISATVTQWKGEIDEVGIYPGILSANAIARICACGIDGSACTHNGSTWTDEGRDATLCGGALGASTCVTATSPADCS